MSSRFTGKKGLRIAGGVLLLAFLIPFIVFAVPDVAGADESYVVLSDSMSPTIEAGDVVIVEETDSDNINKGDIITFDVDDPSNYGDTAEGSTTLVTHRVVNIDQSGSNIQFTTQGDANDVPDRQPVTGEQVVGVVSFHIPYIGYVVSFAGSQTGMILFVVVPSILLIVNEVYELLITEDDGSGDKQSAD